MVLFISKSNLISWFLVPDQTSFKSVEQFSRCSADLLPNMAENICLLSWENKSCYFQVFMCKNDFFLKQSASQQLYLRGYWWAAVAALYELGKQTVLCCSGDGLQVHTTGVPSDLLRKNSVFFKKNQKPSVWENQTTVASETEWVLCCEPWKSVSIEMQSHSLVTVTWETTGWLKMPPSITAH